MRFASELRETAFAAREGLDSTDARATARALLTMSVTDFQQQFRGSPMKRAKRRGLARNAAVVLGNVGTADDVRLLEAALQHDESLVREHAAWALDQIDHQRPCQGKRHASLAAESETGSPVSRD